MTLSHVSLHQQHNVHIFSNLTIQIWFLHYVSTRVKYSLVSNRKDKKPVKISPSHDPTYDSEFWKNNVAVQKLFTRATANLQRSSKGRGEMPTEVAETCSILIKLSWTQSYVQQYLALHSSYSLSSPGIANFSLILRTFRNLFNEFIFSWSKTADSLAYFQES